MLSPSLNLIMAEKWVSILEDSNDDAYYPDGYRLPIVERVLGPLHWGRDSPLVQAPQPEV